ncbi:hypothetical protein Q1695_003547 [Nippostrongylus brasiliensis]|nr:hypothetical protein Q1695_003547 [Nippostrongylus brasiliensis]
MFDMKNLASLLVLLGTAEVLLSAKKCQHGEDWLLEFFEEKHRNLNLTFDCDAVKDAMWGAQLTRDFEGRKNDFPNPTYWCAYSRYTYTYFGYGENWINVLWEQMPHDMIAKTAKLHPKTKYGCYGMWRWHKPRMYLQLPYYEYGFFCLYQKIGSERRCHT